MLNPSIPYGCRKGVPPRWRERKELLAAALGTRPFGLITDCDGTISGIARTPGQAGVDPRCLRALRDLAKRIELVAVVSGRAVENVRRLVGLDGIVYVGNHGLERWQDGQVILAPGAEECRAVVAHVLDEARAKLEGLNLGFENKGVSGAIHYRNASRPLLARRAVLLHARELAEQFGLRVVEGKRVVELRPPIDVDKGSAVAALAGEYRLRGGLYLGDDLSDVSALRAMGKLRRAGGKFYGIGVVGPETPKALRSAADFHVAGVPEIAELLEWLASCAGNGEG